MRYKERISAVRRAGAVGRAVFYLNKLFQLIQVSS